MKGISGILFLLILSVSAGAQETPTKKEIAFSTLQNLIGGKWLIETEWSNGATFKQEIELEWGLNKAIIKAKTYGTVNNQTQEYGLRNEGVRAWNAENREMEFFEFDVFGGITTGKVVIEKQSIYYYYDYLMGDKYVTLCDGWEFVTKDTYNYKTGVREKGDWTSIYLETIAIRQQ